MTSTKRVSHSIEKLTPNGRDRLGSLNGEQPDTVEEEKDASRSEQLGDRFAYIARSARTGSDGPARHIAVALPTAPRLPEPAAPRRADRTDEFETNRARAETPVGHAPYPCPRRQPS